MWQVAGCWSTVFHYYNYARSNKYKNTLRKKERRKAKWIGHSWRRNYLIKYITEGKTVEKIEVAGKRGGKSKRLLNDPKKMRGYWKLKSGSTRSHCVENWIRKLA